MERLIKGFVASTARFVLPWLFAAWLFWASASLPLPLPSWLLVLVVALLGFLLAVDSKLCLERFYRNKEPEKTPISQTARPDLKLHGLLWLIGLYLIQALSMTLG